jgi:large subunit ribosomal protein L1
LKNYYAVIDTLEKEKSNNTLKGDLIKNVFVTSSMGVSYKVKLVKGI